MTGTRKVLLFTDSTVFGEDIADSLSSAGLVDEVYVQASPAGYRLRRYLKDLSSIRGIKHRAVDLVDRINRPGRKMSLDVGSSRLRKWVGVPFKQFSELRTELAADDAVVVVYGTRIVPSWLYKGAFQTINVHWGLSPYYRGVLCTDWAVLNGDLRNIGFTLHGLSGAADGGPIITQGRVTLEPGDTIGSITTRIHWLAKRALLQAVPVARRHKLSSTKQDLSIGRNYRGIDWSVRTSIKLKSLTPISKRAIEACKPELPIIESPGLT